MRAGLTLLNHWHLSALTVTTLAICSLCFLVGCQTKLQHSESKKVIQFSTWGSAEEVAVLKKQLRHFEAQNPTIQVDLLHIPENYYQKLHILAAANLMPAVVFTNSIYFPVYAVHGFFQDLRPLLNDSTEINSRDFYPKALQAFSINNQPDSVGAIPRDISNLVIYINTDLFKQANLPLPNNQWNWEDLIKSSKVLTKDFDTDGTVDQYGFSFYQKPALFTLPFLWSAGGGLIHNSTITSAITNPNLVLNSPESINGIEFYQQLRNKHNVVPRRETVGDANMSQLFIQGKLAMLLSGRWLVPTLRQNAPFNWDIRPFPQGAAGSKVGIDASGYALSSNTKYPKAAWRLITFLSSAESHQAFTQSGLIIPARKDIAESDAFLQPNKQPQNSPLFLEAIKTGIPTQSHPQWNELEEIYNQGLEPVWEGQLSAQKAVKKMLPLLQKVLDETPPPSIKVNHRIESTPHE